MFKFTIRDLFWLILVVAMALGWWVDRNRLAVDHARMQSLRKDAIAFEKLSAALRHELQDQRPLTSITIKVNGFDITTMRTLENGTVLEVSPFP